MEPSLPGIKRKAEEEESARRNVRPSRTTAIGSVLLETQPQDSSPPLTGRTSAAATDNARIVQGNVVTNNYTLCQHETRLEAWLKSLIFDGMSRRRAGLRNVRAPGTCQWLFETEKFKMWEGGLGGESSTVPILVLKGKPGSGKSVLLNTTMERFESLSKNSPEDTLTLGFFFNAMNGALLEQTIEGLYRSLIHQLLMKFSPHHEVNSVLEQFQRSTNGEWDVAILKEIFMALLELAQSQRVYIFLDALDECLTDEEAALQHIGDVVESLQGASTTNVAIRTCFTVRSEAILENFLDLNSVQLIDVKSNNISDIETYIKMEVNKIQSIQPDLRLKLPAILTRRCANMFLWARLAIWRIRNRARRYWRGQDILKEIESLPTELHGLYEALIRSASTKKDGRPLILLQILQVAIGPLTVAEFKSALSYAAEAIESEESIFKSFANLSLEDFSYELYDLSGGLVEITSTLHPQSSSLTETSTSTLIVQFIHKSVTDFVRKGGLSTLDPTLGTEVDAYSHLRVTTICMRLLDTPEAFDISASKRDVGTAPPFLPYASQFWALHARRSDSVMRSDFKPPTNLISCQTQVIVKLFRKFRRAGVYLHADDIPNRNLLTCEFDGTKCRGSEDAQYCQDNLLVLLASEGCARLFTHHAQKCSLDGKCHGNRHILERAFLGAVHRGWIQTTRSVWDLFERKEMEIDVNMYLPSDQPFTALYIASIKGKTDVVEFLLQKGADPLKKSNKPYLLPLHAACAQSNLEVVRLLFRYSETKVKEMLHQVVRGNSERGWTVLHLASNFGHSAIVEELLTYYRILDLNHLVHARTERKQTAIEVARESMSKAGQSMGDRKEKIGRVIYKLEEFTKGTSPKS